MRLNGLFALATTSALAVDFVREVRPIFEKQKNDYRLDIKAVALKHITPGKSGESQLFRFVSGLEKDPSMRVDKRNESLSPLQALAMMNNGLVVQSIRADG